MKVASYHDSFVNNDMDKKLNILTKELFHNYTWSEHQKTMERTANKVYEITQEFFKGVIDKEEAKKLLAEHVPVFPSTKESVIKRQLKENLALQEEVERLRKLIATEEDN